MHYFKVTNKLNYYVFLNNIYLLLRPKDLKIFFLDLYVAFVDCDVRFELPEFDQVDLLGQTFQLSTFHQLASNQRCHN